eukprot:scaffold22938_cov74-Cyclotella_meneghiniana.AAC.1
MAGSPFNAGISAKIYTLNLSTEMPWGYTRWNVRRERLLESIMYGDTFRRSPNLILDHKCHFSRPS